MIESRKCGDPDKSYVARLFAKGNDAILKKIGEEATEAVMACKDGDRTQIVDEVADLWFHSMLALSAFGLKPADVLNELQRREGLSGLEEFAARKAQSTRGGRNMNDVIDVSPVAPKDGMDPERESSLRTIGHISYLLHAMVAVGAVLPGVQASVLLLMVAFIIDMVKKERRSRHLAGVAFLLAHPHRAVGGRPVPGHVLAVDPAARAGLDRLGRDLDLVPLSRRPWLAGPERPQTHAGLNFDPPRP